jgi:signal transduction histidine kinase
MRFVARTKDQDLYMGQLPGPILQKALRTAPEGVARSRTKENIAVFTAWATLDNGWAVAAGTPAAGSDTAFYRFVALLGGAWLVMLLTGIVMARILYSRIDRSLVSTVEVAKRRASGESAAFPASTFAELVELSGAIEKLFEQEREARALSESANQAKDEFLAMLGHELRNPIGAIANASHILEQANPSEEELAMARRVIARQTGNLRRMIDDLLDLSRVLTGKIGLELRPVDLAQCVRHAVESLDAVGRTALHRIELRTLPVWIEGDSARIEQILTNLIINAVNHTPPGKHITITLTRETAQPRLSQAGGVAMAWDGDAVLTVADEGVGIAAATLPRVFDLFFQEHQQADRPKSGLGLGLTLVQRLAQMHGGSVTAASEGLGHGARFTVRIPAIPAPEQAPPMTTPASAAPPPAPAGRRILLIEDNDDGRETMQAMLELDHHVVAAAADGPAGLALLKEFHADAAIVDVGLPGMTGHEVAQAIRAADVRGLDGSPLLLIALTGYGMPEDVKRTKDAGFDAHLVKPADFDKLSKLLAKKA